MRLLPQQKTWRINYSIKRSKHLTGLFLFLLLILVLMWSSVTRQRNLKSWQIRSSDRGDDNRVILLCINYELKSGWVVSKQRHWPLHYNALLFGVEWGGEWCGWSSLFTLNHRLVSWDYPLKWTKRNVISLEYIIYGDVHASVTSQRILLFSKSDFLTIFICFKFHL